MTEQEAQALAARLRRVWQPENLIFELETYPEGVAGFSAHAELGGWVYLKVRTGDAFDELYELGLNRPMLVMADDICYLNDECEGEAWHDQDYDFAAQWMPFFRRNCCLSGCPIEATAHEKTEWMQGFNAKELQSWNLNF